MSIIKRGNSYWIDIGFNHKRYRKRSPDSTHKGAKAYELYLRNKLARGEPLLEEAQPSKQYTFEEVALRWLDVYVRNNNKPSEYLNKQYILNSKLIPYFGKKFINNIDNYGIEQYKNHLLKETKLSPKSINNQLCILSRCLKSAQEWNLIKFVPKIKLLKVPPQKYDYLTETETEILLQHSKGVLHDMILLAVKTGLRFGELIALKWEDINLKDRILTVSRSIVRDVEGSPKNNKLRTIPLSFSVVQMLRNRKGRSGYVFHCTEGFPLKYNYCRYNLRAICRASNLRVIGWHNLRHTFASHLAAQNNSIVAIKELMGHSDVKTTMRYSHVNLTVLKSTIDSLEPAFRFNGTIAAQLQNDRQESEVGFKKNLENP